MQKTLSILMTSLAIHAAWCQDVPYGYNAEVGNYVDVGNNTQLYYETYGEGAPLLMLHGGVFGYINEFEYFIPKLAEKFQVVCLGTRGHVKSDIGNEPFTYQQRANDAYKLIQHLKLDSVTVVGFSDGGYTAFILGAMYPGVVKKMVVMGAGDDPEAAGAEPSALTAEDLMDAFPEYFKKRVANMPEPDRWPESLEMLNDLYNTSIVSKETFSKVQCPVMVMIGDGDDYVSPEHAVAAHRHLPDSRLSIIPDCDHVIFYCNFPAVWESMKAFLSE